jgi:MFS family permease
LAAFLLLGLTSAQIGVSWPAVRADFGLPLDALGILLIANTVGNLMGSVLAGRLAAALGIGSHLLLSNLLGAAGLAGYALAPAWWVIVACGLLVGWGGGSLVSGLSIYVADHHSVRSMNWLHASFGLGATLSPLLVTGLLRVGLSWRWGFTAVALAYLALALGITLTRRQWRTPRRAPGMPAANSAIGLFVTLRRPVVWLSIAIFFVYTGLEMVAGNGAFPSSPRRAAWRWEPPARGCRSTGVAWHAGPGGAGGHRGAVWGRSPAAHEPAAGAGGGAVRLAAARQC